jgi:hypothetical protein
MQIDQYNYEIFLVDYFDGKLSKEEVKKVDLFLAKNPLIQQEFEQAMAIKLEGETLQYGGKEGLKKHEPACGPTHAVSDSARFYLSQESADDALFKDILLKPDLNIIFPHKKGLLKKDRKVAYYYSAAASLIFVVAFVLLTRFTDSDNSMHVSMKKLHKSLPGHTLKNVTKSPSSKDDSSSVNITENVSTQKTKELRTLTKQLVLFINDSVADLSGVNKKRKIDSLSVLPLKELQERRPSLVYLSLPSSHINFKEISREENSAEIHKLKKNFIGGILRKSFFTDIIGNQIHTTVVSNDKGSHRLIHIVCMDFEIHTKRLLK